MLGSKGFVTNFIKNAWNVNISPNVFGFSTFTLPLCMKLTPALLAEPMKKKKKMDPALLKLREDRKRRRLWRECRRLMKHQKQLKPLDEMAVPYALIDDREKRLREKPALSVEKMDSRADLLRNWASYKSSRATADFNTIDKMYRSQTKALKELEIVSPELYAEATKIDENLLPLTLNGPTFTPPIKNYDSPDGEYVDITRKWEAPKLPEVETRKWVKKSAK